MIGALRGQIVEIDQLGEHSVDLVVDVHGVGYRVTVSARHAAQLGGVSSEVALAVHTHVREGAIQLFGFPDAIERRTFESLLSAHGVGPALALGILGALAPADLVRAVAGGDLDALMQVPGVGKKTAQRLQLELAQRFELLAALPDLGTPSEEGLGQRELREALDSLGYQSEEIRLALDQLPGDEPVEVLLPRALQLLAPRR